MGPYITLEFGCRTHGSAGNMAGKSPAQRQPGSVPGEAAEPSVGDQASSSSGDGISDGSGFGFQRLLLTYDCASGRVAEVAHEVYCSR